jgi:hypothetical protein
VNRSDLPGEEWAVFEPFVIRKGIRGYPTPHHRRLLNGIFVDCARNSAIPAFSYAILSISPEPLSLRFGEGGGK